MLKKLIFTIMIAILISLNAKTIDFDLSKYKPPVLKRHSLTFNYDGSTSFDNNEFDRKSNNYFEDGHFKQNTVDSEEDSFGFRNSFRANYSYRIEKNNTERYLYVTSSMYHNYYDKESPKTLTSFSEYDDQTDFYTDKGTYDQDNSNLSLRLNMKYNCRKYFYNKVFAGLGMSFVADKGGENRNYFVKYKRYELNEQNELDYLFTDYGKSEIEDKDHSISINPKFSLGIGKIESVYDARLAVYILQDLEDMRLLKKSPTDSLILEFSKLITQINNERIIDSRKKNVYEFEQILNFLYENDLINNSSTTSAIVYDNWKELKNSDSSYDGNNFSHTSRTSGQLFSISITPKYYSMYTESESLRENKRYDEASNVDDPTFDIEEMILEQRELGISPEISHYFNKPINLNLQLNIQNSISYSYNDVEIEEKYSLYDKTIIDDVAEVETSKENSKKSSHEHEMLFLVRYSLTYSSNPKYIYSAYLSGNYRNTDSDFDNIFSSAVDYKNQVTKAGVRSFYKFSDNLSLIADLAFVKSYRKDKSNNSSSSSNTSSTSWTTSDNNSFDASIKFVYTLF